MSCPVCNGKTSNEIGIKNKHPLVACPSCTCIYVSPTPTASQLENLYEDYQPTEKYIKKLKKKTYTSVYKLMRLKKYRKNGGNTFLDVGCNIGATVRAAQKLGYDAMGIDLDGVSVAKAQELFEKCEFEACSTFDLVKMGRKFDFIYCSEVIEHVPSPHEFVQSLADLMTSGALLYLTTPDTGHRKVPKDFLSWKEVKPPEHIVFFNESSMRHILQEHGFEIIKFFWNHRANLRVVCRKV